MITDKYENNTNALAYLEHGAFYEAQELLRKNVRDTPCCFTLNNLGMFYWEYGMCWESGEVRRAERWGLHYLLCAAKFLTDHINQANLGYVYWQKGIPEKAYLYFSSAWNLSKCKEYAYNIGCCLYMQHQYVEAAEWFDSVYEYDAREKSGNVVSPLLVSAFCRFYAGDDEQCLAALNAYSERHDTRDSYHVLLLRFLLRDYEAVIDEWHLLQAQWYPSTELCAILAMCLRNMPASIAASEIIEAEKWCKCGGQSISMYLQSQVKCNKVIQELNFCPHPIQHCGYYGCTRHQTPIPLMEA